MNTGIFSESQLERIEYDHAVNCMKVEFSKRSDYYTREDGKICLLMLAEWYSFTHDVYIDDIDYDVPKHILDAAIEVEQWFMEGSE